MRNSTDISAEKKEQIQICHQLEKKIVLKMLFVGDFAARMVQEKGFRCVSPAWIREV